MAKNSPVEENLAISTALLHFEGDFGAFDAHQHALLHFVSPSAQRLDFTESFPPH
ncbi:hypothetical protein [Paenibacillus sp. NPDC058174]|uniref:hypothetical protein n=1 Tax=Paenibacillus sp. NPDC058174 TaxID=3346366 RepID=UPI0036DA8DFB